MRPTMWALRICPAFARKCGGTSDFLVTLPHETFLLHWTDSPRKAHRFRARGAAIAAAAACWGRGPGGWRGIVVPVEVPTCCDHPRYGGVRRPRIDCDGCWRAFMASPLTPRPTRVSQRASKGT